MLNYTKGFFYYIDAFEVSTKRMSKKNRQIASEFMSRIRKIVSAIAVPANASGMNTSDRACPASANEERGSEVGVSSRQAWYGAEANESARRDAKWCARKSGGQSDVGFMVGLGESLTLGT